MLEIRIYRNGNKTKSMRLKSPDGYYSVSSEEVFQEIRHYKDIDFKFIDVNRGNADITGERLMLLLKNIEINNTPPVSTEFLNRVIREGGFVKYIKKLEGG